MKPGPLLDWRHTLFVRSRVFRQAMLLVVAISIVPLTIGSVALLRVTRMHALEQIEQSVSTQMRNKQMLFDRLLRDWEHSMIGIALDRNLAEILSRPQEDPVRGIMMRHVIRQIASEVERLPLVSAMYVYAPGDDFVLSNTTKTSLAELSFVSHLRSIPPRTNAPIRVVGEVDGSNLLFSLSVASGAHAITTLVTASRAEIEEYLFEAESEHSPLFFVADAGDRILVATSDAASESTVETMRGALVTSTPLAFHPVKLDGQTYLGMWAESDESGLSIWRFERETSSWESFAVLRKVLVSWTIVLIGAALVLSMISARVTHRPLQRLIRDLGSLVDNERARGSDEYQYIESAVTEIAHRQDKLEHEMRIVSPLLRRSVLRDRLENDIRSDLELDTILKLVGVRMPHEGYYLALVRHRNERQQQVDDRIAELFSAEEAVVTHVASRLDDRFIGSLLSELLHGISDDARLVTVIAHSDRFASLSLLSSKYRVVGERIDSAFFVGAGTLLSESTPGTMNARHGDDELDMRAIVDATLDGEPARAIGLLREQLGSGDASVEHVKYRAFAIYTRLLDAYHLLHIPTCYGADASTDVHADISAADSFRELEGIGRHIIESASTSVNARRDAGYAQIANAAAAFVDRNYARDLSLDDIAGAVGVSSGYLSTVFTSIYSASPIKHLNEIRMDHGLRLLEETGLKIKVIASKVGYNHEQSFIRFFKKAYTILPREYRRLHRQRHSVPIGPAPSDGEPVGSAKARQV